MVTVSYFATETVAAEPPPPPLLHGPTYTHRLLSLSQISELSGRQGHQERPEGQLHAAATDKVP